MMEALIPPKRRFLQEPYGVTSQKTPFLTLMINFGRTGLEGPMYVYAVLIVNLKERAYLQDQDEDGRII
jgi:hypothetical protein